LGGVGDGRRREGGREGHRGRERRRRRRRRDSERRNLKIIAVRGMDVLLTNKEGKRGAVEAKGRRGRRAGGREGRRERKREGKRALTPMTRGLRPEL
jgi:hypothetical protein